jgi:predicted transcriptional regulator
MRRKPVLAGAAGNIGDNDLSYRGRAVNVLTLKISDELDAALQAASRTRGLSRSAVVLEALEQSLGRQAEQAGAAQRWVALWRGRLSVPPSGRGKGTAKPQDERLAHILAKHVR